MKLRTWPFALMLMAILGLSILGCSGSTSPIAPSPERAIENDDPDPIPCGDITTTDLIAGQNMVAGMVEIYNDEDFLYVEYTTTGGWCLEETHVWVGTSLDDVPKNKQGVPIPGHFPYAADHDPVVDNYIYTIPLPGDPGDTVYVMAHAVVVNCETGEGAETAWAGCTLWPFSNRWAYYCSHEIQECCCELDIFNCWITACLSYPGPNSYWETTLSNVPPGYDIENGIPYLGWCIQQTVFLTPGCYDARLVSSLDPNLPDFLQDPDWDNVNYLINHKADCPGADITDIQNAIWYFIDGGVYPSDPDAQCLVDNAVAHGDDFCPQAGDIIAVIVWLGPEKQRTFIEVTCD